MKRKLGWIGVGFLGLIVVLGIIGTLTGDDDDETDGNSTATSGPTATPSDQPQATKTPTPTPTTDPKATSYFLGMAINQTTIDSNECVFTFEQIRRYVNVEWELSGNDYVFLMFSYNDEFWNEGRNVGPDYLKHGLADASQKVVEACSSNP